MATDNAKPAAAATPKVGGIVYARNNVPYYQRYYQHAYKNHVRIWNIHPRGRIYMRIFHTLFFGSLASTLYMIGRKVTGHNTFWGE